MAGLADTITQLRGLRAPGEAPSQPMVSALQNLAAFGSNPGALTASVYRPASAPASGVPLVVVLHGCTQTGAGYAHGAGWTQAAERHGFALLVPEQQRGNNPNLCFNWFSATDHARDQGEALSIRQMIAAMIAQGGIDASRVFVTGLSAGGAMAATMLATYPEVFAGGAVVAGLPHGTATSVSQALDRMRGRGLPGAPALTALARGASGHTGPWPTLSVWHGTADTTVAQANADALVDQWLGVNGIDRAGGRADTVDGAAHRTWCDARGQVVVEDYRIPGMGHGTPLDTRAADAVGTSGAFLLEAGIASTSRIAQFWGISPASAASVPVASVRPIAAPRPAPHPKPRPTPQVPRPVFVRPPSALDIGAIIDDALRVAGLKR